MPQHSICDDERVATFADVADQYCILIDARADSSREDFIKGIGVALGRLFAAAVSLIDVAVERPESRNAECMTNDAWMALYRSLRTKLGKHDVYWKVLDPYSKEAPISSSLGDDLADVYRDIKQALSNYGRTERDSHESVWNWRFNFLIHWGRHCSSASRAIHSLLERFED